MLPAIGVLVLVGVVALLTVVNHSLHEIFTLPDEYRVASEGYQGIVSGTRFWQSFGRSLQFSAIVLGVQIPPGTLVALALPRRGPPVPVCLVVAHCLGSCRGTSSRACVSIRTPAFRTCAGRRRCGSGLDAFWN